MAIAKAHKNNFVSVNALQKQLFKPLLYSRN